LLELRRPGHVVRVGHRGAPALAPENTLRSFDAAVEHGAEIVEIDVLDLADATLVLAHSDDLYEVSHGAAAGRVRALSLAELREVAPELPTLDEGLEHLASLPAGVQVDMKAYGHEPAVADAVRRHGLVGRSFVSGVSLKSLARFAREEPRLPRSVTYPEDRLGLTGRRLAAPLVAPGLGAMRRALPYRLERRLRRVGAAGATLNASVVSPLVVERCHALGAAVYAWTVDDPAEVEQLVSAGIDGIITNDPGIFRLLPST
jgi:glycerophosphoryl diester phosphodiesterase